jgi:tRNA nucleotidyltransferase (CCA-adding enzyme)
LNELPQDIDAYIRTRIPEAMPRQAYELLQRASAMSEEQGWELYLVGGYVRDCFLKIPDYDIDIAVVGDAPALARKLAEESGAQAEIHEPFGTAVLTYEGNTFDLDIVTARSERYSHPGALPIIKPGTIADDMARRDFTVNAMAIRILPGDIGPLFDPHGGLDDMRAGLIRVLHDASFIDDPTRLFRAVKLAVRLGWRIDTHTLELILQAVRDGVLATVSMDRITHELLLIMEEPKAEDTLAELQKLGLLTNIHPTLRWPYPAGRGIILNSGQLSREQRRDAALTVIAAEFAGAPEDAEELARWLRLPAPMVKLMHDVAELIGLWPRLGEEAQMPSVTYRLLHGIDPRALESAIQIDPLTQDTVPYERLRAYLDRLRHVKTELDGHYLRSTGVAPGAIYRKVLDGMLDAKLDGLLRNRADEEEFVRQILKGEA